MRETAQTGQLRQSSEQDFFTIILKWSIQDIDSPLNEALSSETLPKQETDLSTYYDNFKILAFEEARATIAQGFSKVCKYDRLIDDQIDVKKARNSDEGDLMDAQPFTLRLAKPLKANQAHRDVPCSLLFDGVIPDDIEHNRTMNIVLLELKGQDSTQRILGVATERPETQQVFVQLMINSDMYEAFNQQFRANFRWTLRYLSSVVREQRMHEVCAIKPQLPCMQRISEADIDESVTRPLPHYYLPLVDDLNLAQRKVISQFYHQETGCVMLLQGGPGTGKSTVLAGIMQVVHADGKRIMACTHSNRGIHVLAQKTLERLSDAAIILVAHEKKLPPSLKSVALHGWHGFIKQQLADANKVAHSISTHYLTQALASIQEKLARVKVELVKFKLLANEHCYAAPHDISANMIEEALAHIAEIAMQQRRKQPIDVRVQALSTALKRLSDIWQRKHRNKIEKHLLNHAKIIFVTLSASGRRSMIDIDNIDCLLVDEAEQAIEPETLIPMQYLPNHVLLAGDTRQLQARLQSYIFEPAYPNWAKREVSSYKWSMFWRLIQECEVAYLSLNVQYRMHPEICAFPAGKYYDDKLVTAPEILPILPAAHQGIFARPYAVYDIQGTEYENKYTHSVKNDREISYVLKLIRHAKAQQIREKIVVVTPYVAQKKALIRTLNDARLIKCVEVETVDSFQGDESAIIIFSVTRTHVSQFLKAFGRLIVAITSAKQSLIILGKTSAFREHDMGALVQDARTRKVLYLEEILDRQLALPQRSTYVTDYDDDASGAENFRQAEKKFSLNKLIAFKYYRLAAEAGYVEAQYKTALFYLQKDKYEDVVDYDVTLALAWLTKSATEGLSDAQFELATCFEEVVEPPEPEQAFHWYETAAENRHSKAALELARRYRDGQGVLICVSKAIHYYKQAAHNDDADARYELATLLNDKKSEYYDEGCAMYYYRLVATQSPTNLAASRIYGLYCYHKQQYQSTVKYLSRCEPNLSADENYALAIALEAIKPHDKHAYFDKYHRAAQKGHIDATLKTAQLLEDFSVRFTNNLTAARSYYRTAAQAGNTLAQFHFAKMCEEGRGGDEDVVRAFDYYSRAAASKHIEASFHRACLLTDGRGCRQDSQTAFNVFVALAKNQQHINAQYRAGHMLKQGRGCQANLAVAVTVYWEPAARKGHMEAQYQLGLAYLAGNAMEKNITHTMHWFKSAADQGHADAQLHYGRYCFEKGNHSKSERYLRNALRQQKQGATYPLIQLSLQHQGDLREIYRWCESLAKSDHFDVLFWLGRMQEAGIPHQKALTNAIRYYRQAADFGHAHAQLRLGYLLEKGQGTHVNLIEAKQRYEQAAPHSYRANYLLGCLVQDGRGCYVDYVKAYEQLTEFVNGFDKSALLSQMKAPNLLDKSLEEAILLKRSSQQTPDPYQQFSQVRPDPSTSQNELTWTDAHYRLAKLLQHGHGVQLNYVAAKQHYETGAAANHPECIYQLGLMYELGQGVTANTTRARQYYRRAAEHQHHLASVRLSISYSFNRFFSSNPSGEVSSIPTDAQLLDQSKNKGCRIM